LISLVCSFPGSVYQSASEIYGMLRGKKESKPPVPKRCSSLERPQEVNNSESSAVMGPPPPRTKTGKGFSRGAQRKDSTTSIGVATVPNLPDFNQPSADMSKEGYFLKCVPVSQIPGSLKCSRGFGIVSRRYVILIQP